MELKLPTLQQLQASKSMKWAPRDEDTAAQVDKVAMWVAEMDFGLAPQISDAIQDAIEAGLTGYFPPAWREQLPRACAQYQQERFGWDVPPQAVGIAPDVLAILRKVIAATPPGTPVVVPTPAYMPFLTIPGDLGRPVVQVPSPQGPDGRYRLDLEGIAAALRAGASVVVLCNPWNPTGQALSVSELKAFDRVLADFPGVLVFSDEIHSPLLLSATHQPYAAISEGAAARTVTAVATSKGWNTPGLHCAQWIITDESLRARMLPSLEPLAWAATPLGALAASVAYREGGPWLAAVSDQLRANVSQVSQWASEQRACGRGVFVAGEDLPGGALENNQDVQMLIHLPEATYLSWWEDRAGLLGSKPAERLGQLGLVVNDGASLGAGMEQCFRLNLATTPEVLQAGLEIITRALTGN